MSSEKRPGTGIPETIRAALRKVHFSRLTERFPPQGIRAAFLFINSFITIAILSAVAMITRTPFVFPSLGPTAFLFFYAPDAPSSSPRHTIIGHAVGILCGYGSLWICGLTQALPTVEVGVSRSRIFAAALSLAATGAIMVLLKAEHPPAGATTLIVSLGIVSKPFYLVLIEVAVAVLALQAILINRLAGLHYPLWRTRGNPHQTQ